LYKIGKRGEKRIKNIRNNFLKAEGVYKLHGVVNLTKKGDKKDGYRRKKK
jgi:hypothetical protein